MSYLGKSPAPDYEDVRLWFRAFVAPILTREIKIAAISLVTDGGSFSELEMELQRLALRLGAAALPDACRGAVEAWIGRRLSAAVEWPLAIAEDVRREKPSGRLSITPGLPPARATPSGWFGSSQRSRPHIASTSWRR